MNTTLEKLENVQVKSELILRTRSVFLLDQP